MAKSPADDQAQTARSAASRAHSRAKKKGSRGHRTTGGRGHIEAGLAMLLAEPEIQLLMQADRVDVKGLMTELNAISTLLQKSTRGSAGDNPESAHTVTQAIPNAKNYRSGTGVMLLNRQGQLFVAQRVDVNGEAWQLPQGGIDVGEDPRAAALRELREEIGTDDVDVIAESKDWFYYDVPPDIARKAWGGKWQGQRQKWFVMVFKGQDSDINLATEHPEFIAWRWIWPQELAALAVSFKRQLYVDLLGEFATIFRD